MSGADGIVRSWPDLTATPGGRKMLFALLYLAEGAPIGFLWWMLPVELRERGVDADRIGLLIAAIGLPWTLKFLWAPLVDVWRTPRVGLREWAMGAQVVMAVALLPLAVLDLAGAEGIVLALLVVHAFAAATQDVAVDALAVSVVPDAERGAINGWMNAGMLTGRALFGALALRVAATTPRATVVLALVATLMVTLLVLAGIRQRSPDGSARARRSDSFGGHLRAALGRRSTWAGLAFAAVGGAGFEAVGLFAGPLLVDRGLSAAAIGDWRLVTVAAMIMGGLVGGWLADRLGKRTMVAFAGVALAVAVAVVAMLADHGAPSQLLAALDALYFVIGWFTAGSYALFMSVTDRRLGATQFTAFMAMTNLCEVWSSAAAGKLVVDLGYGVSFALLAAVGIVALPLVRWMVDEPSADGDTPAV